MQIRAFRLNKYENCGKVLKFKLQGVSTKVDNFKAAVFYELILNSRKLEKIIIVLNCYNNKNCAQF